MRRSVIGAIVTAVCGAVALSAQAPTPVFKLGTFSQQGRTFVGLVLRDAIVVDVAKANAVLEQKNGSARIVVPADMKALIAQYESAGLRARLADIARGDGAAAASQPPYVHDLKSVTIMPPVMYPETLLNAAVNYSEHAAEMARPAASAPAAPTAADASSSAPGLWERRSGDTRWNPYLFLKPRSAVIASDQAIRIPPGRERTDWECEMVVVIGKRASHVPIEEAKSYIFGYTLENDVSDRGGRGDNRHGSDWLIGKGHDTFAPMGPFIVPAEFIANPQKLGIRFTLSGKLMQDSSTDRMIHTVYDLVHFASNILTLQPGDVISTGSPAGVGSARNPPIFMKPGDVAVCTIEGIGTLTNPVAEAGSGSAPTGASQGGGR